MLSTFVRRRPRPLMRLAASALLSTSALVSTNAAAQEAAPAAVDSTDPMINLLRALVANGVLTRAQGDTMLAQAEAKAAQARAATTQVATDVPEGAAPGGIRVPYVPQVVQEKIREDVKAELLAQGKTEGWATTGAVPEWTRRIKINGDLRVRSESLFFDKNNYDGFVNGQLINAGDPYDFSNVNLIPPAILNSTENRANRLRLRARLGVTAEINPLVTAYLRIATGSDTSPVSTNQTLGGYYSKKDLWLDRAYIDVKPIAGSHIMFGRMTNPFTDPQLNGDELVWDEDINLDGVALQYGRDDLVDGLKVLATGGAFPIDYVDNDVPLPAFSNAKISSSNDRYLLAAEVAASYDLTPDVTVGASAAYYYYSKLEGQLSACFANAPFCLTDYRRPDFAQRGNTLMYLRTILPNPGDPTSNADPQYLGIASQFRVLDGTGHVTWRASDRLSVDLRGTFAKNLAYSPSEIFARAGGRDNVASNNDRCAVALVDNLCPAGQSVFESGDTAWLVRATVGTPQLLRWGDWNISAAYRYAEPDSLVDAFTDSDFRLGGTNSKGFIVGGSLGLMENTSLNARWLSAKEIYGLPFSVDTLQVDLNVAF